MRKDIILLRLSKNYHTYLQTVQISFRVVHLFILIQPKMPTLLVEYQLVVFFSHQPPEVDGYLQDGIQFRQRCSQLSNFCRLILCKSRNLVQIRLRLHDLRFSVLLLLLLFGHHLYHIWKKNV